MDPRFSILGNVAQKIPTHPPSPPHHSPYLQRVDLKRLLFVCSQRAVMNLLAFRNRTLVPPRPLFSSDRVEFVVAGALLSTQRRCSEWGECRKCFFFKPVP
ncbi:hypothetical protein CEXT_561731 [Caerostris extrusa]|uniref:Uncharacterized protein n=1 Tax=Caerostris extrusa TaxID=172846 RepID=A0AAV4S018_CAEEX|nr:hypothetical protein CEXT_561731 [Caerostris extrusa]